MSKKRALSFVLSFALVLSGAIVVPKRAMAEGESEEGSDYGLKNPRVAFNYKETVTFGSYWQEDTNGDGVADESDDKQPIVWRVLEQYDDGTAFIMSEKILDAKAFNSNGVTVIGEDDEETTDYSCTWETSTIRKWLNGNSEGDFFKEAFSSSEQEAVLDCNYINEDNIKDKVFLLSLDDVKNESFGFIEELEKQDQARSAIVTPYVENKGFTGNVESTSWWWLRTIVPNSWTEGINTAAYTFSRAYDNGFFVNSANGGIRPAMLINLKSSYVKSAGSVRISVKRSEWDTVYFGNYNGMKIRWRVLNVTDDDAFLVSDKTLATKAYNDERASITWKDCSLRKWLNEDFYNDSFSDTEKGMIKLTTLVNDGNPDPNFGIDGGEDTEDYVFILSIYDINQLDYGFPNQYWVSSDTRTVQNSNDEEVWWWLRTPGVTEENASCISEYGNVFDSYGYLVNKDDGGIRPALHIDLSSMAWEKGESVKSSPGIIDSTPSPTQTPTSEPTPSSSPEPSSTPSAKPTDGNTPIIQPTVTPTITPAPIVSKDNKTTFSIKNKKTIKKTAKIKVKDKDKIKKITLNGKKIKIKSNKTSITVKLKSYKKYLKKKGKWNTLKVTDKKGNVVTIKFKTK